MPLPSDRSYQDFVRSAFSYLVNPGPVQPNAGVAVSDLYRRYCYYDSNPNIPAKVRLAGNPLLLAMINFINNATVNNRNHIIRIQSDNFNVMNQQAVSGEYQNPPPNMSQQAAAALTSYLHIYPYGTQRVQGSPNQITRPNNRNFVNNWRIGVNVVPGSIADAVPTLITIMDQYPAIDHIKFAAPTIVNKSDSVIIFLRKEAGPYNTIKGDVELQLAMANVGVEPKFAPMWNEFADGYGEAAEAPTNGFSFGLFRCILAYLAYPRRPSTAATLSLPDYQARVDQTFETFGIPLFAPHEQGQLILPPYNHPIRIRFMRALALFRNFPANAFQNLLLTVP